MTLTVALAVVFAFGVVFPFNPFVRASARW